MAGASANGTSTPRSSAKQFRGVPIRRGNHCFARAKGVGQRARRDLRFVEVGRYVKVRGADELLQILKIHEIVVEDDVLLDFVLLGEHFQAHPVGFPMLAQFVRMGGAQDDVNHVRELHQNLAAER